MFELIAGIAALLYAIEILFYLYGSGRKFPRLPDEELPTVTVLVAARNEEDNILFCIESLHGLEYPEGKLEIILIDDSSTDSTLKIITEFIKDKPRFTCITSAEQVGKLRGKTNALVNGLRIAKNEVILTTDADCMVSPTWAKTLASYFTEGVGLVSGYTTQVAKTPFGGMQALDFIYLLGIASGTMNLKLPVSCIGNNMAYRRKAYDEAGGYESIPFSVTEDFNLLMAINKLGKWKIIYPMDKAALVTSHPCPTWKQLIRQKKRWGVGGLKVPLYAFSIMVIAYIVHGALLALPFFFSPIAALFLSSKFLFDFILLWQLHRKLDLLPALKYFVQFEIYYILYVLLLPFIVLSNQTVVWKERKY